MYKLFETLDLKSNAPRGSVDQKNNGLPPTGFRRLYSNSIDKIVEIRFVDGLAFMAKLRQIIELVCELGIGHSEKLIEIVGDRGR